VHLRLSTNEITRSGALAVAAALKDVRGLQRLELNGNMIAEAGVEELKVRLESSHRFWAGDGICAR
jgi:Ran GTPase-activating protein (RanGAP) involved in mRNA processing and transport